MKNLSAKAKILIISTIMIGLLLMVYQLLTFDQFSFWIIILAGLASLAQVFKEEGTTEKSSYNLSWLVYGFTLAIFGAPATVIVITISHLVEWVWHKYPWYIQSYNIATYAIAVSGASLVARIINPTQEINTFQGALALFFGILTFTLINHFLVGLVIKLARGQSFSQSGVFKFLTLMIDFTIMALGVGTALIWAISPFATIFVLAPLFIIRSGLKVPHLQRQSEIDPKTGLFNARYFADEFENELARANRYNRPLTIILGDLDLLRNINNTYGHLAGDVVLKGVANILKTSFREYDLVARFGGEEFAIMVPETTPEDVYARVEEIRKEIEAAEFEVDTSITPITVTISFGISGLYGIPGPDIKSNDIINDADAALYNAKLSGRNFTRMFLSEQHEQLKTLFHISQPEETSFTETTSPITSRFEGANFPPEH